MECLKMMTTTNLRPNLVNRINLYLEATRTTTAANSSVIDVVEVKVVVVIKTENAVEASVVEKNPNNKDKGSETTSRLLSASSSSRNKDVLMEPIVPLLMDLLSFAPCLDIKVTKEEAEVVETAVVDTTTTEEVAT